MDGEVLEAAAAQHLDRLALVGAFGGQQAMQVIDGEDLLAGEFQQDVALLQVRADAGPLAAGLDPASLP